jgi:hypothetical protein
MPRLLLATCFLDLVVEERVDSLLPPRILMVIGAPLIALFKTLCTLAPVPMCNLDLNNSVCPLLAAIASPGPKTGQKSNGAGSVVEAFI